MTPSDIADYLRDALLAEGLAGERVERAVRNAAHGIALELEAERDWLADETAEVVEAAIAWEAGSSDDEDRLSDAVDAFRRARGDFAAWAMRLQAGEQPDEAARAVGGTGRVGSQMKRTLALAKAKTLVERGDWQEADRVVKEAYRGR